MAPKWLIVKRLEQALCLPQDKKSFPLGMEGFVSWDSIVNQETMSLSFLSGRTFTAVLAGLLTVTSLRLSVVSAAMRL